MGWSGWHHLISKGAESLKHFHFLHSFLLDCINVTALFWSYITQTGRASSSTACWWQTTPSLWEQAFNSMCNQFDGQPLSWALMNTAPVFHTCFLFCLSACRCSSATSALEVVWKKQVQRSAKNTWLTSYLYMSKLEAELVLNSVF